MNCLHLFHFYCFFLQHGQWVGTVLLSGCEILPRPSKKEGFCFKIYHPLEHYIWATKGPKGEMAGSITQPLPKDYLIMRADSESDGKIHVLLVGRQCNQIVDIKPFSEEGPTPCPPLLASPLQAVHEVTQDLPTQGDSSPLLGRPCTLFSNSQYPLWFTKSCCQSYH